MSTQQRKTSPAKNLRKNLKRSVSRLSHLPRLRELGPLAKKVSLPRKDSRREKSKHRSNHFRKARSAPPGTNRLERISLEVRRVSMRRIILAWGFGAAFFNISAGAVYVNFIRHPEINANDQIMGVLAAALPLMSFLQVLSARLVDKVGNRKLQMVGCGVIGRSLWIVAAAMPMVAQTSTTFGEWLTTRGVFGAQRTLDVVVACVVVSAAFQAFTGPPFFSWLSDLVPARVRPTFMARRMQVGTAVALVSALGAGYIIDLYPTLEMYCAILIVASICGVLDVGLFVSVKEPPGDAEKRKLSPESAAPLQGFFASLREPLRDSKVRVFLTYLSLLLFSYGSMGAFVWLHMKDVLKYDSVVMGLVLNVLPLLAIVASSRYWGEAVKTYGNKPIMRLGTFGLIFMPVVWFTPLQEYPPLLGAFMFVSGMLFCALEIVNQNLITGVSPHMPRSTIVALVSICGGLSFAIASIASGRIAEWLTGWRFEIFGLTLVKYHLLYLFTVVIRVLNFWLVVPRLEEPKSAPTRLAVREMRRGLRKRSSEVVQIVPEIAQNVAARVTSSFGMRD